MLANENKQSVCKMRIENYTIQMIKVYNSSEKWKWVRLQLLIPGGSRKVRILILISYRVVYIFIGNFKKNRYLNRVSELNGN